MFDACYGAYFALQVRDFIAQGKGAPGPADYDRFAEEAETVAKEAVHQQRPKGRGKFEAQVATLFREHQGYTQHGELGEVFAERIADIVYGDED